MTTEQLVKLKTGYTQLSPLEKNDFKKFMDEYDKATEEQKKRLLERQEFKSLGPLASSGCPCCGKS